MHDCTDPEGISTLVAARLGRPTDSPAGARASAETTGGTSTMTDDRERWAVILGASSGMGEATGKALAAAGYRIFGIHLDFRAGLAHVEEVKAAIATAGTEALFINMNAADDEKRANAITVLRDRFDRSEAEGRHPYVRVVMHSLAFGSLVPFLSDDPKGAVDRKKMEMTQDVMANSLVYWIQDLYRGGFLEQGSKIFSMTSEGSSRVVPSYGVVSSAKAALESHTRQLAMELARTGKGITANTIRAGVTITPALLKIPEHEQMIEITRRRNPTGRMTTPQDVAATIVALSGEGVDFINGEVIGVDGGEFITGA
jgi:enoyl-[acyl-carrier protein] reductase III